MSWYCHNCAAHALDMWDHCAQCKLPRVKSSRTGGSAVPEDVAIYQAKKCFGNYMRWTEEFESVVDQSHMLIMNLRVEPPGAAEPSEMKQLLDFGWVRLCPGHFQREIERGKVVYFEGDSDKPKYMKW